MAFNAGELSAQLSLNMKRFSLGLKQASKEAQNLGSSFKSAFRGASDGANDAGKAIRAAQKDFKDFERIVGGILLSQVFYAGVGAIKSATGALVDFMNNMEKAQIALEYFLESPEAAKGFMAGMKDFAATTAFSTEQALNLSRRLMAAQFEPTQVRGIMEILNDASVASGGTADQLDRIVLALTQISTNGKVKGQELRQLAEANIPIYQILHEQLGIAKEELLDIGNLNIDGNTGVTAILQGLEKRYKGAAERIALTVPGMLETIRDDSKILGEAIFAAPYQAMGKIIRTWRDTLEEVREHMNKGGLGEVVEQMFPPKIQTAIRMIAGSLVSLGKSFMRLGEIVKPIVTTFGGMLVQALGVVMPIIAGLANAVTRLASAAMQVVPPLKYFGAAVVGLLVVQSVGKALFFFWNVMRLGVIASVVAKAVTMLTNAIKGLFIVLTRHPIIAVIMLVAGGLLYLAMQSKTVIKWLDALTQKLAALGGFSVEDTLVPEDDGGIQDWIDQFNQDFTGINDDLTGIGEGFEEAGKEADKAGKKIKDSFIASFDEVYQVPEKNDSGSGDGKGDGGGGLGKLPGLPDLGDIGKSIVDEIPREIELPKFKWPEIPPLPVIPKFDFPKINWPTPPPAVISAWEWFLKIPEWKIVWPQFPPIPIPEFPPLPIPKWPPMPLPEWQPLPLPEWPLLPLPKWNPLPLPEWGPLPLPKWEPALERVKDWTKELEGQFDRLKERLKERWGRAWEGVTVTVPGTVGAVAGAVDRALENMQKQWEAGWQAVPQMVTQALKDALKSAREGLSTLATEWLSLERVFGWLKETLATAAEKTWAAITGTLSFAADNWPAIMEEAGRMLAEIWDKYKWWILGIVGALVLGIIAYFVGIPAAIIGGIGAGLARIGGMFQRLGPTVMGAINGIPKIFRNIVSMLPPEAQQVVDDIVQWFKDLPGNLEEIFEFAKRKFLEKAREYAPAAAEAVTEIVKWFKELPGKVVEVIKSLPSDFAKFTKEQVTNAKDTVEDIRKKFAELPAKLITALKNIPGNTAKMLAELVTSGKQTVEDIKTWFAGLPGKLIEVLKGIPGNTATMLNELPGKAATAIANIVIKFKELPGKLIAALLKIPGDTATMFNKLPGKALTAVANIVTEFKKLPGKIIEAIKDIPKKIGDVFSKIQLPSFETVTAGASAGVKASFKSLGKMTGFKDGGIIDKDSIVRVGEGGRREAIIPLQNETAMQPFAAAVAQEMIGMLPGSNSNYSEPEGGGAPILQVGVLVADDRGLRELDRRLKQIGRSETDRGGR